MSTDLSTSILAALSKALQASARGKVFLWTILRKYWRELFLKSYPGSVANARLNQEIGFLIFFSMCIDQNTELSMGKLATWLKGF